VNASKTGRQFATLLAVADLVGCLVFAVSPGCVIGADGIGWAVFAFNVFCDGAAGIGWVRPWAGVSANKPAQDRESGSSPPGTWMPKAFRSRHHKQKRVC
jgi:hypothetical protein